MTTVAQAMLAALASDPSLLVEARDLDAARVEAIKKEAADPELAILRWAAARGLALLAMLRLCPIPEAEVERLFERLLDNRQWSALEQPSKPPVERSVRARSRRKN